MFTKDEMTNLIGIIDIAIKAGGLQVAEIAIPLARKLAENVHSDDPTSE